MTAYIWDLTAAFATEIPESTSWDILEAQVRHLFNNESASPQFGLVVLTLAPCPSPDAMCIDEGRSSCVGWAEKGSRVMFH